MEWEVDAKRGWLGKKRLRYSDVCEQIERQGAVVRLPLAVLAQGPSCARFPFFGRQGRHGVGAASRAYGRVEASYGRRQETARVLDVSPEALSPQRKPKGAADPESLDLTGKAEAPEASA